MENNQTMRLMRELCRLFSRTGQVKGVRVLFPDPVEMNIARTGAMAGPSGGVSSPGTTFMDGPFKDFGGKTDYLCDPNLWTESGLSRLLGRHEPAALRMQPDDEIFMVAFPGLNLNEFLEMEELHRAFPQKPIISVCGDLERIRSGYYWKSWARTEMGILREFMPKFEITYLLHNFKGTCPGVLFRAYPGPYQACMRRIGSHLIAPVRSVRFTSFQAALVSCRSSCASRKD